MESKFTLISQGYEEDMLITRYGADIFAGLILKSKDRSDGA